MPVVKGRLTCYSGHDLGFDDSDPYADPACRNCLRAEMEDEWLAESHSIAIELLKAEHERLLRDHYDDLANMDCDGCQRAHAIRMEIIALGR